MDVLEKQVEFLLRINGLNLSEFRAASDDQLLKLYQDAVQIVSTISKKTGLEVIERWSELFLQLSEVEMVRLQPMVEYDHTWEPFYLLCVRMMTITRTHPKMMASHGIQQLLAILDKGRRNLRDTAIIMIRKFPETTPLRAKTLLKGDDLAEYLPQ